MKRIVGILAALGIFLNFYCVGSAKELVNENFERTDKVESYGFSSSGGQLKIEKVYDGAKEISSLVLLGDNGSKDVTAYKKFENTGKYAAAELRFRLEDSMSNFSVIIGEGTTVLAKVNVGIAGEVSVSDGSEFVRFNDTTMKVNNWCVLRICNNPQKRRVDVRCNNEILRDLKYYSDYSENGIDYIILKANGIKPKVVLNYYIIENGMGLNVNVRDIVPPVSEAPVPHAVKGIININYNGEYKFFDYQPIMRNERVLIPFRRMFEMMGLEIDYNSETNTATGKAADTEIRLTEGSRAAFVNGKEVTLDVMPVIYENSFYVPVRFVAQTMNKNVDWDDETDTVFIKD